MKFLYVYLAVIGFVAAVDYYKVLGLKRSSTKKEIKSQYRKLSREYHPDKNKSADAEKKFIELAEAYEVLADDEKRRIYDQYGEEGLKMNGNQHHQDPFDMFNQFGGGFFNGGKRQERRGHNIEIQIDVTLEELFLGKYMDIEFSKQIICPSCRGSGAKSHDHIKKCNQCGGSGVRVVRQQFAPGLYQQIQTHCNACGGKGQIIVQNCPVCSGHKVMRGTEQINLFIERGMVHGERIVFEGESDQSPDIGAGDLVFVLNELPHPKFIRQGLDLRINHTITLKQALLGFDTKIKHLDQSEIILKRTGTTKNGNLILNHEFVMKIEKNGMPRHMYPDERGDLYAKIYVEIPDSLNDEQKKAIDKLF